MKAGPVFIGGTWRPPVSGETSATVNPATEDTVKGAMTGIFYNKGEVCAAGSRLSLEERMHDEFMAKLTERVKGLRVGDPMDKATRMGPVVSALQMETVLAYIEAGKKEGARLVTGGGRAKAGSGKGDFIEPAIQGTRLVILQASR